VKNGFYGFNPSDWDYSDIVPIPKKDKDARDPSKIGVLQLFAVLPKFTPVYSTKDFKNTWKQTTFW
jgi:hypothetical protein